MELLQSSFGKAFDNFIDILYGLGHHLAANGKSLAPRQYLFGLLNPPQKYLNGGSKIGFEN